MTDTNENEFYQMGVSPEMYEALERDFKEVLQSMVGEKTMERFKSEYEKLHRALKTSYESEKRLIKTVRELNEVILSNAARVKAAIKLTQEDSSTIGLLKKEVDKAWKLVETAKEKEEKARKIISELKSEIGQLHKTVEMGSGLQFSQDNTVQKLMETKQNMEHTITQKQEEILHLTEQKAAADERSARLEADLHSKQEELTKKFAELEQKQEELTQMTRKFKNVEQMEQKQKDQLKEMKDEIANNLKKIQDQETEKAHNVATIEAKEKMITEHKETYRALEKDHQRIEDISRHLQKEKETLLNSKAELEEMRQELKHKLAIAQKDLKKKSALNRDLEALNKRLSEDRIDALNDKNVAMNSINALTREIEYLRKQADADRQALEGLESKKEKFKQNLDGIQKKIQELEDEKKADKSTIETMREQAKSNRKVQNQLTLETTKLEKERDKFSLEAAKANSNLMQMIEEVKLKKNLIGELKKENLDVEAKLKTQQNLYEAVRSDRNLYSKNLIEAQDEVSELKRKFKIASHQISQLKDEIESKDTALTSTQHDLAVAKKEADKTKEEKNNLMKLNEQLKSNNQQMQQAQNKLTYIIKETHIEYEKKQKEVSKVINERDVLGTQLIRRNDELALLYEKIKILQTTLSKGENQYQQRLEDIKILNYSIADLKCELRIVKSQASQIDDLRKEIISLNKQLLTERLSVKALSEELENPLNYHRWRKLEGTDPDTWEMLQKIQTLQKRLIKKTEEVVEKDVIIQEKEKLYVELKNLLARQPGPEVAEQLSIYQQNLKEKTNQMKAMAAELNMYQAQVNEYKYEIERLTRELQEMKRRYYEQKRREQNAKEAQNKASGAAYAGIQAQTGPQQRFTGGGFNLAI